MYYECVLLGKGMLLFPVLVIFGNFYSGIYDLFYFCWKRMVLAAQLMTKTKNKSYVFFKGVTVIAQLNFLFKKKRFLKGIHFKLN